MFLPYQAIMHQGTMLTQLLGFALMAGSALMLHRALFLASAALEAILFFHSWVPPSAVIHGSVSVPALVASVSAAAVLAVTIVVGSERARVD